MPENIIKCIGGFSTDFLSPYAGLISIKNCFEKKQNYNIVLWGPQDIVCSYTTSWYTKVFYMYIISTLRGTSNYASIALLHCMQIIIIIAANIMTILL